MKKLLLFTVLFALVSVVYVPAVFAQSAISVVGASLDFNMPTDMTFHLDAKSSSPITKAQLTVRFPSTSVSQRFNPQLEPATEVKPNVTWVIDRQRVSAAGGYLPPGAQGEYSWTIQDQAGNTLTTPFTAFQVNDQRFEWKTLPDKRFVIYWYQGDQNFAQRIADRVNQTLDKIESSIGAKIEQQIRIFIYADSAAFQSILQPGNSEFTGATPVTEHGVMLVHTSPEDLQFGLVAVPHEFVHIAIDQSLKGGFGQLTMPLWMNEGLASYYEYDPPQMEDRYATALDAAKRSDTLIRLRNFESTRPSDYEGNMLMYGQGWSVVEYMLKQYGPDKMHQIFLELKKGTADEAFMTVLGVDQDGLENEWRKSMGLAPRNYAKPATPTPGAIPTFAISSGFTAVPGSAPQSATESTTATPEPARTTISSAITAAAPNPTPAPQSSAGNAGTGSGGLCGLGGFALAMFGAWQWRRKHTRLPR